jgi:hypothetical protein
MGLCLLFRDLYYYHRRRIQQGRQAGGGYELRRYRVLWRAEQIVGSSDFRHDQDESL